MRPELQAKLLQHLNKKKGEQGFTLVELLVVIVIIGILTAIALPSFLNQSAKAKQSEAKQNVASINKTQQAWRTESTSFTTSFADLALGRLSGAVVSNYTYTLPTGSATVATVQATATDANLKSYSGRVEITNTAAGTDSVINKEWNSVICEATTPQASVAAVPSSGSACGSGTVATK
jgi:type IV pilus assembly protein PilA